MICDKGAKNIQWGKGVFSANGPGKLDINMQRNEVQCLFSTVSKNWDFPVAQTVKNLPAVQGTHVQSLGEEEPLEKGMAIHASTLAWRIPQTEKPSRLQSVVLQPGTQLSN